MFNFVWFVVVCLCIPFVFSWRGLILGTGQWLVQYVGPCDNPEQYEIAVEPSRKKINRTHDGFDFHVDVTRVIDCSVDVKIDIYQLVDGGFKYFQTMADDCACTFLMKHAKENVQRALTMANIDPPDCPLPAGKGRWLVLNLLQCEEPEQYEVPIEITRKKINRTHDAFSFHANLDREFDVTYGIEIIANKEVDGGYKFYTQITDESFCNMAKKYIGSNWQDIFTKANIDPPECPVPEGELTIEDYVIDYSQMEETGVYGKYDVSVYITYSGRRLACARLLVQFEKQRQEDDEDEDDDY